MAAVVAAGEVKATGPMPTVLPLASSTVARSAFSAVTSKLLWPLVVQEAVSCPEASMSDVSALPLTDPAPL